MQSTTFHEYKETPGTCSACGNSPVNHFHTYVAYTMSVWGTGSKWNPLYALRAFSGVLADRIEPMLYRGIAALPISRFERDAENAVTYRSQVVWEEAKRRGIEMEQLVLGNSRTDIYRARVGGKALYFHSLPTAYFQKAHESWVDDKFLLKRELREAGVPAPRSISTRTLKEARRAFEELDGSVVVKPRLGSRARHTTTNVCTLQELEEAFKSAQKLCRYVAIEEFLEGPVCRATCVGGKLAGFFEAHPPRITGDGHSTIVQLIEKQNSQKPERVGDIVLTDEHRAHLSRLTLGENSVLPEGKVVALTHRTGRLFGGETRELRDDIHPKLRATLERAARVVGGPIVGFDLIISDASADPDKQTWGIIEANTLPYIDLHYLPLHGEPSPVARDVWDWVERHL
jgi:cyanophycin synthetase